MFDIDTIKNGDEGYQKFNIPKVGDIDNPNAVRVRNLKNNYEKDIYCSTKESALRLLLAHKGDLTDDTVIQDEFAHDNTGVYFIISDKYHRG